MSKSYITTIKEFMSNGYKCVITRVSYVILITMIYRVDLGGTVDMFIFLKEINTIMQL